MRDSTRALQDTKGLERKARQKPRVFVSCALAFVISGGQDPLHEGAFNWLESLKFDQAQQQVMLQDYIDAIKEPQCRVPEPTNQMPRGRLAAMAV